MANATLEAVKFCRECRWVRVSLGDRLISFWRPYYFAKCANPACGTDDHGDRYVDGRPEGMLYCSVVRDSARRCGPSGTHWEAKR